MYKLHNRCRSCGFGPQDLPDGVKAAPSSEKLVKAFSLGLQPLANDFCKESDQHAGFFPLDVLVCPRCNLAQLSVVVDPSLLYRHYLYRTSPSRMMEDHFSKLVEVFKRENVTGNILEIGSNDGRFLHYLKKQGYKNVCGIDPAENLATQAGANDVPSIIGLFDGSTAEKYRQLFPYGADLVIARHVFCHIDDWHSFIHNLEAVTNPASVVAIEVPWVQNLLDRYEWDTCLTPGQKVMTSDGYRSIEEIAEGDAVLTHSGDFRKVTHKFERDYSGDVLEIHAYGYNRPLIVTPEHPIYCDAGNGPCFTKACFVERGYRTVKPSINSPVFASNGWEYGISVTHTRGRGKAVHGTYRTTFQLDKDLCRIGGFYLAEGFYDCRGRNSCSAHFAFGKTESEKALAESCAESIRRHNSKANVRLTKCGWHVHTYGPLAKMLSEQFGNGAENKRVPGWAFHMSVDLTLEMVEAYVKGDGYVYRNGNYLRASTVSEQLALGISVLSNKVGWAVSVNVGKPLSPRRIHKNKHLTLHPKPPIDILIRRNQRRKNKVSHDGVNQFQSVKSVTRRPYSGKVYNLEVEGENSYVTPQSAVHNCYHEHTSYFSFSALSYLIKGTAFEMHDAMEFPIHGGAILVLLTRKGSNRVRDNGNIDSFLKREKCSIKEWIEFDARATANIQILSDMVRGLVDEGKRVAGYGASAKSTVAINACGFTKREVAYVTDNTPEKLYRFIPGTDIPILWDGAHVADIPDYMVCFAWNFMPEILEKNQAYLKAGGKFIVPIPVPKIIQ